MIAILLAGGVALISSVFVVPLLIEFLLSKGVGQQIREDGPAMHVVKAGTPTMGGIAILIALILGYLAGHLKLGVPVSKEGLLVVAVALGTGSIGYMDDLLKVRKRRSLGLTKAGKILGQLSVSLGFALASHYWAKVPSSISFVRLGGLNIKVGTLAWLVFAVVVIVGTSNAVNLTDGLDGLAAGSSIFSFACLALIGYWQFRHFSIYRVPHGLDLAVVSISMVGALAGFLWWNASPAQIFMGDTGSLAIGAALGALCLEMRLDLLLPLLGGLFVVITLSVIVQVFSFRVFHRRVLRMAPLHHHFELKGWPETTIIVRFWILAGIFTALGLGAFYADFLSLGAVVR